MGVTVETEKVGDAAGLVEGTYGVSCPSRIARVAVGLGGTLADGPEQLERKSTAEIRLAAGKRLNFRIFFQNCLSQKHIGQKENRVR
jgi:hypothetical protein